MNSFGNLCLISRGMNSKFSNNMPKAKLENFQHIAREQSLKLQEMFEVVQGKEDWDTQKINDFTQSAQKKLELFLLKDRDIASLSEAEESLP